MPMSIPPAPANAVHLFVSDAGTHIRWLCDAMEGHGEIEPVPPNPLVLLERAASLRPRTVLIDFLTEHPHQLFSTLELLRREQPQIPVIGLGLSTHPASMLAALRAGVLEFIDMAAPAADVPPTLRALTERRAEQAGTPRDGMTLALVGARGGLGTTTLATHLAVAAQELQQGRTDPAAAQRGTVLLDLGLPERDGLLYLNLQSDFHLVDGVLHLQRLDRTLLQTALAQHAGGAAVLPLPAKLSQIREISLADVQLLLRKLAEFYALRIADLGGCAAVDFVTQVARDADQVWVVCEQGLGAIVSTAALLERLRESGVPQDRLSLIVNRFEPDAVLSARDIAQRLGIGPFHVLPARPQVLLDANSRGELLVESRRSDPYAQAVFGLARSLLPTLPDTASLAQGRGWSTFMTQIAGRWKGQRRDRP
ncbi:AAA family ATPase [Xylophilus sp. ASV27]|uniref:AAA family ATPase n=1 Tax=Xylophilus sp. ASV27 TaxID=2795129 RepID=UPI0018EE14D7|nr:histidine kinase [Xylophilus sp. ASV27]